MGISRSRGWLTTRGEVPDGDRMTLRNRGLVRKISTWPEPMSLPPRSLEGRRRVEDADDTVRQPPPRRHDCCRGRSTVPDSAPPDQQRRDQPGERKGNDATSQASGKEIRMARGKRIPAAAKRPASPKVNVARIAHLPEDCRVDIPDFSLTGSTSVDQSDDIVGTNSTREGVHQQAWEHSGRWGVGDREIEHAPHRQFHGYSRAEPNDGCMQMCFRPPPART